MSKVILTIGNPDFVPIPLQDLKSNVIPIFDPEIDGQNVVNQLKDDLKRLFRIPDDVRAAEVILVQKNFEKAEQKFRVRNFKKHHRAK